MKKLSYDQRAWLARRSIQIMRRRRAENKRRRTRSSQLAIQPDASTRSRVRPISVRVDVGGSQYRMTAEERIPMPFHLCFEDNYEQTAECLEAVRESMLHGEEIQASGVRLTTIASYLDFATIKKCSPSVALVLAAEFDKSRAKRVSPDFGAGAAEYKIPLINIDRWDRKLKRMLDDIGFFKLLGIDRPERVPSQRKMVMQFQTGGMVARDEVAAITDKMEELLTAEFPGLRDDDDFQITIMQILGAIQEATENACDHAYKGSDIPTFNQRWWATGAIDVAKRHLNLIVYDQGNTIPKMLPTWEKYPFVASRMARFQRAVRRVLGDDEQDAIKMRLAMAAPRSSTDHPHRGKGFVLFRDVVEQSKAAKLLILSRNGRFLYQKGARPHAEALKTPLNGTLVQWDLWV